MSSINTTIRTFVALELPGEVKAALNDINRKLTGHLGEAARAVRWVRPEATHLTLKFLGDVPVGMQQLLKEAIVRGCADHEPIELSLGDLGVFPNLKRPRVLWVGLSGDETNMQALSSLQSAVSRELSELGFKQDNTFHPHLTLGRVHEEATPEQIDSIRNALAFSSQQVTTVSFRLDEVNLIKSDLRPGGSVYTRLVAIPL